ncbi:MAG: hypothetical protein HC895_02305 [Leptolyngbyaceae cyanobacterium SM1_3_5]|nr:hypothetical protein [Leptolyngbyaceae cyanobacterium SM1_3_5]
MASEAPQPQLDLLSPWDLPIEQSLSESDRARVGQALQQFLQALHTTDQEAIELLKTAISELGTSPVSPTEIAVTKTGLNQQQIDDFDRYFDVHHVQAENAAICLMRSILITYQRSLQLRHKQQFDPVQIAQEKQGFISYAHLLKRVFNLEQS